MQTKYEVKNTQGMNNYNNKKMHHKIFRICSVKCPSRCCRKLLLVSMELLLLLSPAANHSPFSPKVLNVPFSHNSTVEVEGSSGTSRASSMFYSC